VNGKICLIGFGEVGSILAADLAGAGELHAYDILFPKPESIPSRALAGTSVIAGANVAEAARDCALIFCAVTAANDLDAARSVIAGLQPGAFYVDFNSASPKTKQTAAGLIDNAGGRYVEAAVMSPFPPKRLASPMLLGGRHAEAFLHETGAALGFSGATVFAPEVGKASAAKMCRSVMIKGIEALLTESLLAARRYRVEDTVLKSLSDLVPAADWDALARYMISRSLQHGGRRAEEMREVAATVREAGIFPAMSAAAAERHKWAAGYASALGEQDLKALLDHILERNTEAL
jgi:3-hydroxyisobutyrate dehydrogenase-like beta-hydroxyacid dehydrogenase